MCLLIFAHQVSSQYPLVLAANRDEFHARAAAVSKFWDSHPQMLAGRDLEQGGTWMGITRQGRFAAVTNYRDPDRSSPAPRSRGELCVNFLAGSTSAPQFLEHLRPIADEYAGFNLLLGDSQQLWYYSNSAPEGNIEMLSPGIYGLSNARLETPWPKSERGKSHLGELLKREALTHENLAQVVGDRSTANAAALENAGLNGAMDELLSAQFIVTPTYGTRCTTTLWTTATGIAHWQERSFDSTGGQIDLRDESFALDQPGTAGE